MILVCYGNKGFMTTAGIPVKNRPEVIELLEALLLPQHIAMVKTEGRGIKNLDKAQENKLSDKYAKLAASSHTT